MSRDHYGTTAANRLARADVKGFETGRAQDNFTFLVTLKQIFATEGFVQKEPFPENRFPV